MLSSSITTFAASAMQDDEKEVNVQVTIENYQEITEELNVPIEVQEAIAEKYEKYPDAKAIVHFADNAYSDEIPYMKIGYATFYLN